MEIIAIVALLISVNALYVAAEFATVSARKSRIDQMAAQGNRLAAMLLPIVKDPQALDRYIAACQLGITASSLVLGAFGQTTVAAAIAPLLVDLGDGSTSLTTGLAQPAAQSIAATGVLIFFTVLQVVLGELFPKSVAVQYPERLALATVIPMQWSVVLFRPFIWFFNGSGSLVLKRLGIDYSQGHTHVHSPQEIELLVAGSHEGGLLHDEERQMLRNALRLRELTARQVMLPRIRLVAAPIDSAVSDLIDKALQTGFTRIPIYRNTIDNVIGFVHIKDLFQLHLDGRGNPKDILREITYVPEGLPVVEIWATLRSQRQVMAIVLDEYGGTAGLITVEDLIEEIFGELQDEFDEEMALISSDKEGRLHLRGDLLVTDVNEYLALNLPVDEADTLGGLVFATLGRVPLVGDEVTIGRPRVTIRVEAMDGLSITEVSLQRPSGTAAQIDEWEMADHD